MFDIFWQFFPVLKGKKQKNIKNLSKPQLLSAKKVEQLFDNNARFEKNIDLVARKSILYKITSYFRVLFRLF